MARKQARSSTEAQPTREIDRIRDIILGPQIQDLNGKLQAAVREAKDLRRDLDRLTNQESDQTDNLKKLRSDMRRADRELRKQIREATELLKAYQLEREALADLLIKLGNLMKTRGSLGQVLEGLEEPEKS